MQISYLTTLVYHNTRHGIEIVMYIIVLRMFLPIEKT